MKTCKLQTFLKIFIGLTAVAMIYIYGFVVKANGDNVEHLHSSWLIWQGYIPYKDFFQHHNPLLWYISSPLVYFLINYIEIFSIFNAISVCAVYIIIYYQIKIMKIIGYSHIARLFLAAIEISSYSIMWALDYRPDTFMYLCLFLGIYNLFRYEQNPKLYLLVLSFLGFFLSFMFTQKVLLILAIIGFYIIGIFYTKKYDFKDIIWSTLVPIILFTIFNIYLILVDAFEIYWKSNYYFNSKIPDIFYRDKIVFPPLEFFEFYIFIPLGGISAIYFLIRGKSYEKLLSLLFIGETFYRLFYFSAFLHYSILWLILGMMLTVMVLDKSVKYRKIISLIGIVYLLYSLGYNYIKTYKIEIEKHNKVYGYEYMFYNLTPCDYALSGYYAVDNLRAKDLGYYGILLGQIDVLGEKLKIAPRDNLNELIKIKKPKIISSKIYWDTYWEQRGSKFPAHQIDKSIIRTYYQPTEIKNMYILKPEYQKHQCRYNGKKWEYID